MFSKDDQELMDEFSEVIEEVGVAVVDRSLRISIEEAATGFKEELNNLSSIVINEFDNITNRVDKRLDNQNTVLGRLGEEGTKLEKMFADTERLVEIMKELESTTKMLDIMHDMESSIKRINKSNQEFRKTIKEGKSDLLEQKKELETAIHSFEKHANKVDKQYQYFKDVHKDIIDEINETASDIQTNWKCDVENFLNKISDIYSKFNKTVKEFNHTTADYHNEVNRQFEKQNNHIMGLLQENRDEREELYSKVEDKIKVVDEKFSKYFTIFTTINCIFIICLILFFLIQFNII
ncbi:MAG: hypothetical protein ACOCRU_00025 [bacterium]